MEKAGQIAIDIYKVCETEKLKNDFAPKDQIKRAAFSISSNIAEGFEYNNNNEFVRFLKYAKGSAGELRSQLFILKELEIIENEFYNNKFSELNSLSGQLSSFIKYIKDYQNKIK
ncbi:four helix bundle protein [Adhaeribacter aerolatus]|uniref:Four helix bundle protein n=1 Tax=Adhaeribacter aerolatus TaxID=670289 RepID=A0A512AYA9_9BACT|nr:four helix bundle protein [Adhaeribacter aerolatus]GEO04680.1 four helix bundle protein [Adhaeribacter aerolatus]